MYAAHNAAPMADPRGLGALGVKTTPTPAQLAAGSLDFGPHTGRWPANDAERAAWYAILCKRFVMPPLDELEHQTLTYITTTLPRNLDEPASEKREMRAELSKKATAIKLAALGLGPIPRGGMPKFGPTLYWNPELAFKAIVCGPLTPAELARAKELGNQSMAMLSKRARDKRKSKLKKIVGVAALVVGAVYLGPMISGALKGSAAAGAAGSTGATGAAVAGKVKVAAVAAKAGTAAKVAKVASVAAPILKKGGAQAAASTAAQTAAKVASKAAIGKAAAVAKEGATLAAQAQALIPKVVKVANNVRTIQAIADGEIPPPPITLEGDSFREYAGSLAQQLLEKEVADKRQQLTEAQLAADRAEIERQIMVLQQQATAQLPVPSRVVSSPMPGGATIGAEVGAARTDEMMKYALLAVPILAAVILRA